MEVIVYILFGGLIAVIIYKTLIRTKQSKLVEDISLNLATRVNANTVDLGIDIQERLSEANIDLQAIKASLSEINSIGGVK